MDKKQYVKPQQRVYELSPRAALLAESPPERLPVVIDT